MFKTERLIGKWCVIALAAAFALFTAMNTPGDMG